MSRRLIFIAVFGLTPAFVAGWSAQAPRDAVLRTGTASLAGVVVSAERGNPPVSRAVVVLGGGELPSFTAVADADGRFEFAGLPSGQFTLTASKTSFVSMAYGQAEPGRGSGLPIALRDGERRTGLRWTLPRAAAISGRILDDAGQPMRGATVMAQRPRLVDGERHFVSC